MVSSGIITTFEFPKGFFVACFPPTEVGRRYQGQIIKTLNTSPGQKQHFSAISSGCEAIFMSKYIGVKFTLRCSSSYVIKKEFDSSLFYHNKP